MTCKAATFPGVTAYNSNTFALGDYRRALLGTVLLGLSAAAAVAAIGTAATLGAAWLVAGTLVRNPDLRVKAPVALETIGLPQPQRRLAAAGEVFAVRFAGLSPPAVELSEAATPAAVAAAPAPAAVPLPRQRMAEREDQIPLPPARPLDAPLREAKAEIVRPRPRPAARQPDPEPEITGSIAAPPRTIPAPPPAKAPAPADAPVPRAFTAPAIAERRPGPALAYADPNSMLAPESRTAIYDIAAHTVYLPSGRRLEAHSGLGYRLDDPRYVRDKARGPTPPNVYSLSLRESLFHGVRAIRLNPVADSKMFGRDGILAHTYMLGPSGQSFGCVSFKDYQEFLHAFQRGEIDRLVVVPHLENPPAAARA